MVKDLEKEIEVRLEYIIDNCYRWTFDAKKVKQYVQRHCNGSVLNLFAGKNIVVDHEIRVDSSDEFRPQYLMSAGDFLKIAESESFKYDTIIYDPPWNKRKAKEKYNGRYIGKFTKLKNDIVDLLNPNGIIISCGYTITNFGKSRGMYLTDLSVVNPKGEIRPYFVSIERKIIHPYEYLFVR